MDEDPKSSFSHPELFDALARVVAQALNGDAPPSEAPLIWAIVATPRIPPPGGARLNTYVTNATPATLAHFLRDVAKDVERASIAEAIDSARDPSTETRQ